MPCCLNCDDEMSQTAFDAGKMCCRMPLFEGDKQYCPECRTPLDDCGSIEIIRRGEEEETWCMGCWQDQEDEMRKNGWMADGDDDEESECGSEDSDCESEGDTRGDEPDEEEKIGAALWRTRNIEMTKVCEKILDDGMLTKEERYKECWALINNDPVGKALSLFTGLNVRASRKPATPGFWGIKIDDWFVYVPGEIKPHMELAHSLQEKGHAIWEREMLSFGEPQQIEITCEDA